MNTGAYYFKFLSKQEKTDFQAKQLIQGRNEKHYLEMKFFSFHEFVISAFRLNAVDYKYWTDVANKKID